MPFGDNRGLIDTLVLTSVDVTSTSHPSPPFEDVHVNLVSHANASGSSSSSFGLFSSHIPF